MKEIMNDIRGLFDTPANQESTELRMQEAEKQYEELETKYQELESQGYLVLDYEHELQGEMIEYWKSGEEIQPETFLYGVGFFIFFLILSSKILNSKPRKKRGK